MRGIFKLYQFWLAVEPFLLALFFGWGLPVIIPSNPHNGIVITILGTVISAPFFVWAYILYKTQNENKGELRKRIFPQKGRCRMVFAFGIFFIIAGFIMVVSQLDFHNQAPSTTSTQTPNLPVATPKIPTFVDASKIDPSQPVIFSLGEGGLHIVYKWSDLENGSEKLMLLSGLVPFNVHVDNGRLYIDISVYGGKDSLPIEIKSN